VIRLEQNYRSTKNILEAASALVSNNKERKGKWLWTDSGTGEKLGLYSGFDAENEALFIADTTERLLAEHPDYRVAVLYRTNSQSRQIEEALRRYGRKYVVVGGFSFYQRAEVKDIVAYLKLAVAPVDSLSLLRIINTQARGIGKTTVEQVETYALAQGLAMWTAIGRMVDEQQFPARAQAALAAFRTMMEELSETVASKPLHEAIRFIEERTGYRQMLEQEDTPEAEARLENMAELVNAAAEAVERGETVTEFLDHAALVADADQIDERAQVSLLTLHNTKGLEFPIVFMSGMEEGLFPHSRSFLSESAMEEERRLCYVGMTRAEKHLILTWARYRRRFGGGEQERSIASRFLQEIPPALIANLGGGGAVPQVDLTAERHVVRETVKQNLYTGKTYNSVENVAQFFAERGVPFPAAQTAGGSRPVASRSLPSAPAAPKKPARTGMVVEHPKYGTGTVVRREGDGEDAKITVSFPGYGLKKLVEKYAGLKKG
jgi:DNA helicase-2/ATP-dependent DNA helicase PcrA